MSKGPLQEAFNRRENIGARLRTTKNRAAFNALLPQWTSANRNLQAALIKYVPEAVHNGTNIKNNSALNTILKGLVQNGYKGDVEPLIAKFKGLKTRYQQSPAANPNYTNSLKSILKSLGTHVSAANAVVNSNANMPIKFQAVSEALKAALAAKNANIGQLRAALAEKNASIQAGTAQNKALIGGMEKELVQARAETAVAKAAAARASLEAHQQSNRANIAERMAKRANTAVTEAQTRAANANAKAEAAVKAQAAAEAAARNASAANKAKAEANAKAAAAAAAKALNEAKKAHAANKAAVQAEANATAAAIKRNLEAAQKLHAAEAAAAHGLAAAAEARALAAQKNALEATAKAKANRANRNAQVAAAKAQVDAEAAKVAAALEAKEAAEAAAAAARNANAASKAALNRAAANAAAKAAEAQAAANAAKAQHAQEKANLQRQLNSATASVAEKNAARAALQAEKNASEKARNAAAAQARNATSRAALLGAALTLGSVKKLKNMGAPAAAAQLTRGGTLFRMGIMNNWKKNAEKFINTNNFKTFENAALRAAANGNNANKYKQEFTRWFLAHKNNLKRKAVTNIKKYRYDGPLGMGASKGLPRPEYLHAKPMINAEHVFYTAITNANREAKYKKYLNKVEKFKNENRIVQQSKIGKLQNNARAKARVNFNARYNQYFKGMVNTATLTSLKTVRDAAANYLNKAGNPENLKAKLQEINKDIADRKKLVNNLKTRSNISDYKDIQNKLRQMGNNWSKYNITNLRKLYEKHFNANGKPKYTKTKIPIYYKGSNKGHAGKKVIHMRNGKAYILSDKGDYYPVLALGQGSTNLAQGTGTANKWYKIGTPVNANKAPTWNTLRNAQPPTNTNTNTNRFGVTSAMNSVNRKPRVSGTIVKNKSGKAYFINRAGGRHPVIGTNKKTGRFVFNKTGQKEAQNYNRVKKGEIQVS